MVCLACCYNYKGNYHRVSEINIFIFVYSKLVQTIAVKISNIEETTYYTHQARYFILSPRNPFTRHNFQNFVIIFWLLSVTRWLSRATGIQNCLKLILKKATNTNGMLSVGFQDQASPHSHESEREKNRKKEEDGR